MNSEEQFRDAIHERLRGLVGDDEAAYLMERIPPRPWDQLATREELGIVHDDIEGLKADVAELKTDVAELKTDVAELKTDVVELRMDVAGLKVGFDGLRTEMVLRFEQHEDRTALLVRERIDAQTRQLLFGIIGALLVMALINIGATLA